ncbi:MAG: FAD-dependent oxidoreductase [Candidatus Margulisiibacteriota bacterium]
MKIAIVGGGVTGLSLAYFLTKKGKRVTVFEKEPYLGGLASTFPFQNTRLEKFYHHLFSSDREMLRLITELGLLSEVVWSRSSMGFRTKGKSYPFTSPFDLLYFSAISPWSRIKLGLLSLKSKRIKDWQKLSSIRASDWLKAEAGEEAYRVVWEPLLLAKFGKYANEVPAGWVWARLNARAASRGLVSERLGYLRGSFQVLWDTLAKKLEIVRSHPIEKTDELSQFDKVIFTNAPAGIKYLGNICAVLETEQKISDYYWLNIGEPGFAFCAVIEHNLAFGDEHYCGKRAVYLSNYVNQDDPLWNMNDEEVLKRYLRDLLRIKPDFKYNRSWVFRERFAQPVIGLNYQIPPFEVEPGRIYMVNNAQIYPQDRGLNDSCKLARRFSDII